MPAQQSTMIKSSRTIVIVVVVAALTIIGSAQSQGSDGNQQGSGGNQQGGNGNGNGDTSMSTSSGSSSFISSLLSTVLSIPGTLLNIPLTIVSTLLGTVLSTVLTPITTLLSPITTIVSTLLTPVSLIFNTVTLPLQAFLSVATTVGGGLGTLLSYVVSNISGLLSSLLSSSSGPSRRRRAIGSTMMGMMLRILYLPFRLLLTIADGSLTPIGYIYDIIMWPFHLIFGNLDIFVPFYTEITSYVNNTISSFLLNLSQYSQDKASDLVDFAWAITKNRVLPLLDSLLVKLMDSGLLPDDITTILNDMHVAYTWIHILGIL